jgi:hypothetical protein
MASGLRIVEAPFAPALVTRLFNFSSAFSKETEHAFARHVSTLAEIHVFGSGDEEVTGFQMWPAPVRMPGGVVVMMGGKLRLARAARRTGLPQRSNLAFAERHAAREGEQWYRLSVASVFGFNSLASSLSSFFVLGSPEEPRELREVFAAQVERFCQVNGFAANADGTVNVRFSLPASLLQEANNPIFRSRAAVRRYEQLVPRWHDPASTTYVAWGWKFDRSNIDALRKAGEKSL